MDICLKENTNHFLISPETIHGILWLQTHFESEHWESISNNKVIIEKNDAKQLSKDALQAGISVNFVASFSNSKKFY